MLLKYSQCEKRSKINSNSKQQRGTGNMKLIAGSSALNTRLPRKTVKGFATKRPSSHLRPLPGSGKEEHRTPIDASDSSNDSGLGFDQHLDVAGNVHAVLRLSEREPAWDNEHPAAKRKKLEIKLESDDANDNFSFSHAMSKSHKTHSQPGGLVSECLMPSRGSAGASGMQRPLGGGAGNGVSGGNGANGNGPRGSLGRLPPRPLPISSRRPPGPVSLSSPVMGQSRDGRVQLQIASQPEQQHRARYQTEGSRGAVKDRSGNGFPVVKLVGYNKPTTLQVFIGTDMGRVAPHMFYQACKVSGKNSTPCAEKKIDGTIVIEVEFDPAKDMTITCDCVGILKERNVDVEHRFPDQSGTRNKKKSTRCRMVFRTTISHPDGTSEILQTTSQPIVCTQPPGVPEICKKSLSVASCTGGMELFILGKNFLKDTRVMFQLSDIEPGWEETVQPDKEFLQQTHLVCIVPPYQRCDIIEPVTVRLLVTSSGKTSEPHSFTYMPAANPVHQPPVGTSDIPHSCLNLVSSGLTHGCVDLNRAFNKPSLGPPPAALILPGTGKSPAALLPGLPNQYLSVDPSPARMKKDDHPIRLWTSVPLVHPAKVEDMKARDDEQGKILGLGLKMMPPPPLLPIAARRASSNVLIGPDGNSVMPPAGLKTEIPDESSQESTQLSPEELKGIDLRMKPVPPAIAIATVSDLLSTQSPSMATFRQFVNPTDAPLPTQSGQSVEKYLSRIENPIATKLANIAANASGGSGSGSGSGTGIAVAAAVAATTVSSSSSAVPSANQSDPTAQAINKICTTETAVDSQFNAPIIFGPSQAPNNNLLTASLPPSVSETQKISFVNDMTLPTIYSSALSAVKKEQPKPQLVDQTTLQNTMASSLLAVGLNTVVSENQTKPKYQENALSDMCSGQSVAPVLLPPVTDAALSTFSAAVVNSTEQSSLNVPTLLSTISDSSNIMETSAPLIFNTSQQQASKSLLSSIEVSQKAGEQLIDNSNISNQSSSSPSVLSSVGVLGPSHNVLSASVTNPNSATLNISTQPVPIGGNLLAVTQAEATLMTGTSDTRLDALVSSAIESRILEANHQAQTTEKLNVFASSGSIMSAVPTENAVLGAPTQMALNSNIGNLTTSPPPISIQEMTLNSALVVPSVNSFPLNALPSTQSAVQITQENLILNDTVSAAFNTMLNTGSSTKVVDASLALNPLNEPGLTLQAAGGGTTHMVLSNSTCTPPIAMKSLIMGTTDITDSNMLSTIQTPQISGKSIVNSSMLGSINECISNTGLTSPVAVKTMILTTPTEVKSPIITTAMDVKDILAPATLKEEMVLSAATSHCTSPIAMKKIILDSASIVSNMHSNPTLEIKSILSAQPAESLLAAPVPHVSLSTEKLDALVESTMSKHILTSSQVHSSPTTTSMNIEGPIGAPTNSLPLTTQSLATILGSSLSPTLSNNTSLGAPCSALLPVSDTGELHGSATVVSLDNPNISLATSQALQDRSTEMLSLQSQAVTESSLMTIFSAENETSAKDPTLETVSVVSSIPSVPVVSSIPVVPSVPVVPVIPAAPVPSVSTTCPPLLNHHLGMFGQQPAVSVHTLLNSNPSATDAQTLNHSIPFPSTNSSTEGLMTTAPVTLASKIGDVTSTTVQRGQAQAIINEVLIDLANGESGKKMEVIVTQDNTVNKEVENPKFVVTGMECKIATSNSVESCNSAVTKLEVQAVHLLQQQQKLQMLQQQQSITDQEKQKEEKEQLVSSTSLPVVPVSSVSSTTQTTTQTTKGPVQGPTQKKLEEGMVPQELTQMSDSDLLSYINTSCFDQV